MSKLNEEYRLCAEATNASTYEDPVSVCEHNHLVDRMYEIVREAQATGQIESLIPLLDEAPSARWLAHQLIEIAHIDESVESRCFSIVEQLAEGNDLGAYGEKLWLDEMRLRRKR